MANDENISTRMGPAVRRIFKLLSLDKSDIYDIYIFSIFAGLVSLSLPLGIQSIIGFVMAASMSDSIIVLVFLVVLGTFLNGLLQIRQLQLIEKIEQKIFVRYALEYGSRIPKLDISVLESYYLPELVNRFFDVTTLQKSLRKILIDIPAAIIQVVLGTILLAFYHPLFIAFGLILLFFIIVIIRFTSNNGFKTSLETSDYKYKVAAWFEEIARGVKTFKFAQSTTLNIDKTDVLLNGYLKARTSHFKVLEIQYWSLIMFKLLITAAMLILGVTLLVDQEINIGQFIAADIVILSIITSVEKLVNSMDQVYESLTAVEKLNKVAEAKLEEFGKLSLSKNNKGIAIDFENVNFSYDNHNDVLTDITLSIKSGEWVGIMGNSGSGKTSVLRLITGAFREFTGKILIDGIPIKNYDQSTIRAETGIFLSKQDLFKGTLLENISIGNSSISIDEILKVAELTGLLGIIQGFDKGLETIIDPEANKFSQEIKHKILLNRALLGHNKLLLLENPFVFFTKKQKQTLIEYLRTKSLTLVSTGTSEESFEGFDRIIRIEKGKI
jgi:ATP-binding cassette subfamily B protein